MTTTNYRFIFDLNYDINSKRVEKPIALELDCNLILKKDRIESILRAKHNSSLKLNLIIFSDLHPTDIALLKYWKENNFLICLPIEHLFNGANKLVLKKIISLKIPILLVESKNYFKNNLGPGLLDLNVFFKLIEENYNLDVQKIRKLIQKGSLFYMVKYPNWFKLKKETIFKDKDLNELFKVLFEK